MELTIREATIDDLESVLELNRKLFEYEYENHDKSLDLEWTFSEEGKKYFKERILSKDSLVIVAVLKGEVVGYLCGSITEGEFFRKIGKVAELENTFVLEEHRRKGIGTKLFRRFLDWCRARGVERVKVYAYSDNKNAISFYRKNGFKDYVVYLEMEI